MPAAVPLQAAASISSSRGVARAWWCSPLHSNLGGRCCRSCCTSAHACDDAALASPCAGAKYVSAYACRGLTCACLPPRRLASATCNVAPLRCEPPLLSSVGFARGRAAPSQAAARARGVQPRALSSSTRAEVDAVDAAQDSSGVAAAPPSTASAAEEAALPPVDWRLVGGEATSAAGRVRSRRSLLAAARRLNDGYPRAGHHSSSELHAHPCALARPYARSAGAAAHTTSGELQTLISSCTLA